MQRYLLNIRYLCHTHFTLYRGYNHLNTIIGAFRYKATMLMIFITFILRLLHRIQLLVLYVIKHIL
ncbi:hypothetical protein DP106_12820 [Halonotius pteroides]|uniref:Uncharacterized protein n=1 Tax=Halonotius pteroides TaxID=268735 RepID=A0A3A6QL15_9EURY|nr:hypothetical protein DP106_12820 [Halonotius pteroides]